MKNFLFLLLFPIFILFFVSCEDETPEPEEPTGTLGITLRDPVLTFYNDWWDYASKYQIYVDDELELVSDYSGFEVTNIKVSPGVRQVGAAITDLNGIWLYSVQNSFTVQEDYVTEVGFSSWFRANYPTPNYLNEFNSMDDFTVKWGNWSINNSRLYCDNSGSDNHQIRWDNSSTFSSKMRVAVDIEASFNATDTIEAGIAIKSATSEDFYLFIITGVGSYLFKWENSWQFLDSNNKIGESGTLLMVLKNNFLNCYLNDELLVGYSVSENFNSVILYSWGNSGVYFDNLKIYSDNISTLRTVHKKNQDLIDNSYSRSAPWHNKEKESPKTIRLP